MAEDRYNFSLSSMTILPKVLEEDSYSQTKLVWLMGARSFSQLSTVMQHKAERRSDLLKSVTLMSLFYLSCNLCQYK